MIHQELCNEIVMLAQRLESGEVNALELILAANSRFLTVVVEPHTEPDPQVQAALNRLAKAVVLALERDKGTILAETLRKIGYGVAVGLFGVDFFKKILSRN